MKLFTSISQLFFLLVGLSLISGCGGGDEPDPINITVTNFTASIAENPSNGDVIGTLEASVNRGEITYSIDSETPNGAMEINATTGQITVKDRTDFNFELRTSVTATFTATVEGVTETGTITVNITDVLETVQQRLDGGELPSQIVGSGTPVDSLYGKTFQGGSIAHYYATGGAAGDCIIMHKERLASGKTQSEANTLAENLSAGGRSDWKLPTKAQVDLFCGNITADNKSAFPPVSPDVNEYWTSTNCGGICYRSFFFQVGRSVCSGGGTPSSNTYNVMAVRVYRQPS